MEISVKKLDDCRRKLTVTVPAERVTEEMERAYRSLSRSVKLKGFRPGRAPRKVLEVQFGGRVRDEVRKNLVSSTLGDALEREKLNPTVLPSLDTEGLAVAAGETFTYELEVEVWPEFRLAGYKGIKAVRKTVEVKDEDVEESLKMMRERHAQFVPVEGRELADGDFALVDITREVGGKRTGDRKGVLLEMGDDVYIPGFCSKLTGMKPEETRTFTLTIPDDFPEEAERGKEASFTVTLRAIKEKRLPELDDEFCKEIGDYAGVEELRRAVREDHEKYAEAGVKNDLVSQINDYLLKKNKVPLPAKRLEAETARIAEDHAKRLAAHGIRKEDILGKKDELLRSARESAEKTLTLSLIYTEIARKEEITASDEDVEKRIERLAAGIGKDSQQVRVALEKEERLGDLKEDIIKQKVIDFLIGHAKIKNK